MTARRTWGGSLHQTFRLLPSPTPNLRMFMEADGARPEDILAQLPYDTSRAGASPGGRPDPRRYRDAKQVYQTAGLLFEDDAGRVRVTALGEAVRRWLDIINARNFPILGRHAAYALAACQLRNPTGAGRTYDEDVVVFPFAFIWRAMLQLGNQITTDELNRGMFRVTHEEGLADVIERIKRARASGDLDDIGPETITGTAKNDRVIPWISLASFGWTLLTDKRTTGGDYYTIPAATERLVRDAAQIRHRHRQYHSVRDYVLQISRSAGLPPDLR